MSTILTNEDFLKKLQEFNIPSIPLEQYRTAISKIKFRCPCGNEFLSSPNIIYYSFGCCPECTYKIRAEHRRVTKEDYEKRLHKTRPTLFVDGEFNGTSDKVSLKCSICNNVWNLPSAFTALGYTGDKTGCPYCDGERITKENSFGFKHPELIKYIDSDIDLFSVAEFSRTVVDVRCPNCNSVKSTKLTTLSTGGFNCNVCSDGVSIPNKMIRYILLSIQDQLDFYEFEYSKNLNG